MSRGGGRRQESSHRRIHVHQALRAVRTGHSAPPIPAQPQAVQALRGQQLLSEQEAEAGVEDQTPVGDVGEPPHHGHRAHTRSLPRSGLFEPTSARSYNGCCGNVLRNPRSGVCPAC